MICTPRSGLKIELIYTRISIKTPTACDVSRCFDPAGNLQHQSEARSDKMQSGRTFIYRKRKTGAAASVGSMRGSRRTNITAGV